MAKRRKIALIYEYNENWIGGSYYIQNLIAALNHLPEIDKPILFIYTENDAHFDKLSYITKYPFLFKRNYEDNKIKGLRLFVYKVFRKIFKREVFSIFHNDLKDIVFPAANEYLFSPKQQFLFWIPDFQEHYLPHFFKKDEVDARKQYQNYILKNGKHLVLSSVAAQKDFNEIYPSNDLKQYVLPFAVSHPPIDQTEDVCAKYDIPERFFICSNQFWIHKNHKVLIQAVHSLKKKGTNIFIAFTGKEHDYRNPQYFQELKDLASELDINDRIKFLGFISREDQLILMKKSLAVIQPSLFEGWSTVIEDAKCLGVPVIASNISVHKEQLEKYNPKIFFPPTNYDLLSNCISDILNVSVSNTYDYSYQNDVSEFGRNFFNIVNKLFG